LEEDNDYQAEREIKYWDKIKNDED
jgi:hypothetical protein